jgi:hypothetical protein
VRGLHGSSQLRQNVARDFLAHTSGIAAARAQRDNFKTTYPSDFSIKISFLIKCYLSTAITFHISPTRDGFFIAFTPVHHQLSGCRFIYVGEEMHIGLFQLS